jgi:hypothetical protein
MLSYSEEERKRIINHLGEDLYSLAMQLDFCMILRIGELKVLKWSDINSLIAPTCTCFQLQKKSLNPYLRV